MAAIERLWAKETVLSPRPTEAGRRLNKERLIALRDEINKVIQELEEEEWLS